MGAAVRGTRCAGELVPAVLSVPVPSFEGISLAHQLTRVKSGGSDFGTCQFQSAGTAGDSP